MNKINNIHKDPLADLFTGLPQEKLSDNFRVNMMNMIRKEELLIKKRNRIWSIIGIITACLCLLGVSIYTVTNISWENYRLTALTWSPLFSFYSYLVFLAGVLLLGDFLLRKHYRKKHTKETD